jgi:hypothetical protein
MSTESKRNDEIFVNVGAFCIDLIDLESHSVLMEMMNDEIFLNVGAFCIDLVDVESHSALTQLMWSFTPH